jgi:hypothetical protein
MKKAKWLLAASKLLFSFSAAAHLLDIQGDVFTNDVALRTFKFQCEPGKILLQISVYTRPADVSFEVRSPKGILLGKQSAGVATINAWALQITNRGDHELIVTPHKTAGHWQVRIDQVPGLAALYRQVASGALMMLIALTAVFIWWFHSRVKWRWFWAGAGIWTVGVALKFAVALPLNPVTHRQKRTGGLEAVPGFDLFGVDDRHF